jgi:hypothetical protein
MYWTIEFRLGFGFDLEVTDSRPVYFTKLSSAGRTLHPAAFDGVVLLLPFTIITIGECYEVEQ